MAFPRIDSLINQGVPAGEALAIQDQVTEMGGATPPSQGGSSITLQGNFFEYASQTGTGNGADTTEDTLQTLTLPANALSAVGKGVYIYAWGKYSGDTNTKTAKLYFGSETVSAQTTGAAGNVAWALEMVVMKAGASLQVVSSQSIVGTAHGGVSNNITAAETDTSAITIKLTGQDSTSAAANRVIVNGMFCTFMN